MKSVNVALHAKPEGRIAAIKEWLYRQNTGGRISTLLLFLPPGLMVFTLLVIFPITESGIYSFYRWNGFTALAQSGRWVGWQNYQFILQDPMFHRAIWNTVKIVLISLLIQLPLAMMLALSVASKSTVNSLFRLVFFLPFILADVVAGLIWRFIYDGNFGLVAAVTQLFGLDPFFPLADRAWAFNAILIVVIWKYFGYHMMIYIAGLQSVPKDLVEAATLDGASRMQIIFRIKLPLIMPAIRLSVFFSVIGALQFFEMAMPLVTSGGPSGSAHTIVTYLYEFGIVRSRIGFGSAVAVLLFVMCAIFAFIYQRFVMARNSA
ncbi:MAG: sugar ABC transporter permease [Natronospirillum sp.]